MTDTAFQATFSDFKVIKGRKVAQIILEVPIEAADDALRKLGGVPQFATEQWVAVCPIKVDAPPEAPKQRREYTLAQKAGMMCGNKRFWAFIGSPLNSPADALNAEDAADFMRRICGVTTRADIIEGTDAGDKFKTLVNEFDAWNGRIGRPE